MTLGHRERNDSTTMNDVARCAGVSTTTVSHVLNGTRRVHPVTLRAVEDAITRTGYIPNTVARSLARSATNTIGVAVPAFSNHYFSEIVQAIEAQCSRNGLMLLLSDTHNDLDQELKVVQALHQRRVDGILLAPTSDPARRVLRYLEEHKIPVVLIDRLVSRRFDQVGVENRRAMAELVGHLVLRHGHKRIGFVSGLGGLATTQERIEGFSTGLAAAGIAADETLIECGQSRVDLARVAVRKLLRLGEPPTAIVTGNNLMTIGAMQALGEAALRVPDDVALVGFDDFDWANFFSPRLTVIAPPNDELGTRAVNLLIKRIGKPDGTRRTIRLRPHLRLRNSCGCSDRGFVGEDPTAGDGSALE